MGKRLKNVWEKIIDKENLNKAYKLPKRGKKDKEYILNFERKRVERVNSLHNDLENKNM